jgi:hypothetical protein
LILIEDIYRIKTDFMKINRKDMYRILPGLLLFFVLIITTCCPFPVQRESLKLPGCEFKITDEEGQPLKDCSLTLYWMSYPHGRLEDEIAFQSDVNGEIIVREKTFQETVMPLFMHGVPEYFWKYYIFKEGYITVTGAMYDIKKGETINIDITMREGESIYFKSFKEYSEFPTGGMPRSEDGRIGGPMEMR